MLPRFVIPVMWTMVAEVPVEANTLEEAKAKVLNGDYSRLPNSHGLPSNGTYLNDSFVINENEEAMERASLLSPEPLTVSDMPGNCFPGYCGPGEGPTPHLHAEKRSVDAAAIDSTIPPRRTDPRCFNTMAQSGQHVPGCVCTFTDSKGNKLNR